MSTTITITSPGDYHTFQRDGSDKADIPITGTYTGTAPASVEASFNGGAYAVVDASPGGGTFSGTLSTQAAGQGTLTVRDSGVPAVTDTAAYIGIGDVFVCAGQSNSAGELDNFQSYSHATLKATMVASGTSVWAELVDPSGANPLRGSVWPLLATYIMADQAVPVGFICVAQGSTGLVAAGAAWAKNNARYANMITRYTAAAPGGCKALLWYQGETDIAGGTSQAAYQTALSLMLDDFQADLSLSTKMVCALVGRVPSVTASAINAIRGAQQNRIDNDADILAGPPCYDQAFTDDSVGRIHWTTDAEAAILAARWWRCLAAHYYSGADAAQGPTVAAAERINRRVTLTMTGGTGAWVGESNTTGWSYTDDGVAVSIADCYASGTDLVLVLSKEPSGVELVSFASGVTADSAQVTDSGAITEFSPVAFVSQAVTDSTPAGVSSWWR